MKPQCNRVLRARGWKNLLTLYGRLVISGSLHTLILMLTGLKKDHSLYRALRWGFVLSGFPLQNALPRICISLIGTNITFLRHSRLNLLFKLTMSWSIAS